MSQYSISRGEWKRRKDAGALAAAKLKVDEGEMEVSEDIFGNIEGNNLHGVKSLLKNDASLLETKDGEGRTPLLFSVLSGPDEISKFLVSKGADVNARMKSGDTALMVAALNRNLDLAKVLVSKNADVNAAEKEQGETVLHKAAQGGDQGLIKLLLSKGAEVSHKRKDGWTPLHIAAFEGHFEAVKLLVEKGAKLSAKAKDGTTPLEAAEKGSGSDHKRVVDFLKTAE